MSHKSNPRQRKTFDRRVRFFSEQNDDQRPERIAKILTVAALEQARLEAEAAQDRDRRARAETAPTETSDG